MNTLKYYSRFLNESILEGLSEYEKVDLWEKGVRKVNVKACSDDKLKRYYSIADIKGYSDICDLIRETAEDRGMDMKFFGAKSSTAAKDPELVVKEPTSAAKEPKAPSDSIFDSEPVEPVRRRHATAKIVDPSFFDDPVEDEGTRFKEDDFGKKPATPPEEIAKPGSAVDEPVGKKYDSVLEELKARAEEKLPRVVTNGMTDAEVDRYEESLFRELVPLSGGSKTEAGEILSAWNYGMHRYLNDGDWFYGFGETWNMSA